jgi:hypothetical protein
MNDERFRDPTEQSRTESVTIQRLFALAAQRVGGGPPLVQHLRITYSELRTYLAGEAMPPEEVLLRAVDLLIEDSKAMTNGLSEQAIRSFLVSQSSGL